MLLCNEHGAGLFQYLENKISLQNILHLKNKISLQNVLHKCTVFEFQYTATNGMAEIQELSKAGLLNIGTLIYVSPVAPLDKLLYHVIIIINIKENGVEVLHLKKGFFIKNAEKVSISFLTNNNNYFNFNRGIKIILGKKLKIHEIESLHSRMEKLLLQPQIPYGLYNKNALNCESLAFYVKNGHKTTSYQVINFINKYGFFGNVAVSLFDKVMIITNKIGFFLSYIKNKKKQ